MADFNIQLQGQRLITAEILYRLPDYPALLQSFIWQEYDVVPDFPALKKFILFWRRELDGPIHSIKIARHDVITWSDMNHVNGLYLL